MSAKPTVVIISGNSNTGGAVLETLFGQYAGEANVRSVVRKKENGNALRRFEGLEVITGDVAKPLILKPVFSGCSAAFFSTPASPDRADLGKKFVDVCIDNGVEYAIIVSIIGADEKATLYQRQFAEIEEYAMSKTSTPIKLEVGDKGKVMFKPIILRSALFFQNFYTSLGGLQEGSLYYPLGDDGKIGHVDLADVGRAAARILLNPAPHANKIYNIVAEYHAGNQIAGAVTMKANKGTKYFNVDDNTAEQAFEALGLQPWIAKGNVEMLRWFREGNGQDVKNDYEEITGSAPTRFGTFIKECIKPLL